MKKIQCMLLSAAAISLVGCGGGGDTGSSAPLTSTIPVPASAPVPIASSDEINPANALLVASIADRAIARYIDYNELTGVIGTVVFGQPAPIPASVACGSMDADGALGVSTLSETAYDITLLGCRTQLGTLLQSGTIGVDGYQQAADHSQMAFYTAPRGIAMDGGDGADLVSGNIAYSYTVTDADGSSDYAYCHTGQLDYVHNAKADQYRNLDISLVQSGSVSAPGFTVTVSALDIDTMRTPVTRMHVTTPAPLHVDTGAATLTGSVQVVSSKDGSRVQYDYADSGSLRVRNWDSQGRLLLDVVKQEGDADLKTAQNAAFN